MTNNVSISRFDLLVLARDILESQSRSKFTSKMHAAVPTGTDVITTEMIVDEAKKLEKFVDGFGS